MNTRERFVKCCRFEAVNRVPIVEIGVWGQAFDRWLEEGMPKEADWDINHFKRSEHFGLEQIEFPQVNVAMNPPFEKRILQEDDRTILYMDKDGATRKALKVGRGKSWDTAACMDQFLKFAVENREDFEKIKQLFNPYERSRYPENWNKCLKQYQVRDYPLTLTPGGGFGLYWMLRRWMGTENACTIFHDEPVLVEEMLDFLTEFFIHLSQEISKDIRADWHCYSEDFAFKTGPLISPSIFKKFLLPRYRRMNDHLCSLGIDIISVDSDGNFEVLLPMLIESGVNHILPVEQAAGMDAVRIRKQYGKALGMLGSIDKRELAKGKKEIEKELIRQVPFLLETGGYIPTVDHTVPPDVSYENFVYYLDLKRKIIEGHYGA